MHIAEGVVASWELVLLMNRLVQLTEDKLPDFSSSSCSSVRENGWWFVGKARLVRSFGCSQAMLGTRGATCTGSPLRVVLSPAPREPSCNPTYFFPYFVFLFHRPNRRLLNLSVLQFFYVMWLSTSNKIHCWCPFGNSGCGGEVCVCKCKVRQNLEVFVASLLLWEL